MVVYNPVTQGFSKVPAPGGNLEKTPPSYCLRSEALTVIYHITTRDAWDAAQAAGEYEAPSLAEEGFIHCSGDEAQTLRVVQRLYSGVTGLQVLDVDAIRLRAEVKREPSHSGSGEIYPHIYGKINLDAVVRVRDLTLDADGRHRL